MRARRRVAFRTVNLSPDLAESGLWLTGARTIQELVEIALIKVILHDT